MKFAPLLLLLLALVLQPTCADIRNDAKNSTTPKLISVTTLTRHGSRAPDKILAQVSCQPLLIKAKPNDPLKSVFVNKFGTLPGELTAFGQVQMEAVGRWIKQRYGEKDLDFVDTEDFFRDTRDWIFTARAGSRQQRSMMALAQGLFPGTSVPIAVTARNVDAVLGGPAPQCGHLTAPMIVDWHKTKGQAVVLGDYERAVEPFERICNVSLKSNPVNAAPGGANPHAWIGDVSDLLDSVEENFHERDLPPFFSSKEFAEEYEALTELAFRLEQESHFDDPRGAVMFAGGFPEMLLGNLERVVANGGKRPKGVPKMNLFACSRELEYGLSHLFGWEKAIHLRGQPEGRVLAGSTIVWELWRVDGEYYVDTLLFQPPSGVNDPPESFVLELQNRTRLADYRAKYQEAIAKTGDWKRVCKVKDEVLEGHSPAFWAACTAVVLLLLGLAYRRGFRNGYRQI